MRMVLTFPGKACFRWQHWCFSSSCLRSCTFFFCVKLVGTLLILLSIVCLVMYFPGGLLDYRGRRYTVPLSPAISFNLQVPKRSSVDWLHWASRAQDPGWIPLWQLPPSECLIRCYGGANTLPLLIWISKLCKLSKNRFVRLLWWPVMHWCLKFLRHQESWQVVAFGHELLLLYRITEDYETHTPCADPPMAGCICLNKAFLGPHSKFA